MFSKRSKRTLLVAGAALLGAATVSASAFSMLGSHMWIYTYYATAAKQNQVGIGFDQCYNGTVSTRITGQRTSHYRQEIFGYCSSGGGVPY